VQATHDSPPGALQHFADFFIGQTLNFPQQYDRFVGRRQLCERRANTLAQLFVLDLFVWVRARHVRYRIDPVAVTLLVITFKERLATFLTLAVDREVHDDTIQPGVEARFFLELLDIGEDVANASWETSNASSRSWSIPSAIATTLRW